MDVTEATFEKDVLERSREVPVVVDFWAEWCGPCRTLGPVLERLADEADGEWELAKVDVDSNQRLAAAAGVQGIPAVRAFKDGKQIAEFVGALPESQVRQWLKGLGPSPSDIAFERAQSFERDGELEAAAEAYRDVLREEPGHFPARSALSAIELRLRAGAPDVDALMAQADADPTNVDTATRLADALMVEGRLDEAFALLIETVKRTAGDDRERARKHLLTLLDTLTPDDPRVLTARRSLSMALF